MGTTLLTAAAVLGLAAQCQHSFPPQMILAIAKQESQVAPDTFDAAAISKPNHDGTRDYGLMQINSGNFGWLRLTEEAALDPCVSIAAAETVLRTLSAYNSGSGTGSPTYAKAAYLRLRSLAMAAQPSVPDSSPNQPEQGVSFDDRPAIAGGETFFGK